MKGKLQEYALIAEIVSAICIVLSLVFVGLQVRQGAEETAENTKAIRVAAFQDLTTEILRMGESVYTDSELSKITRNAFFGGELSEDESWRMETYLINVVRFGEIAFLQYKEGFISTEQLNSALGVVVATWNLPEMKRVWGYLPVDNEFHAYIEARFNNN